MQVYNAPKKQLSMWETLLQIHYVDFVIDNDDADYYVSLTEQFENELIESVKLIIPDDKNAGSITGTELQSDSELWHQSRWCRITASICKTVTDLGKRVYDVNNRTVFYNWLWNKFWHKQHFTTIDMLYGINEEPCAVKKYEEFMKVTVTKSGLWINKAYPCLAASPDGLIIAENQLVGILEVKCFKILKTRSVQELLESRKTIKTIVRQCFQVVNEQFFLRKSHAYYYQIQLQLLITEANYCDFVLHSGVGPPHVERIFQDEQVQGEIIRHCYKFWKCVLVPEYFLMRVPRNLLPSVNMA